MQKLTICLLLAGLAFQACKTPGAMGGKKGMSLFNGKDLTGWIIYGTEKWYVDNGELVCAPTLNTATSAPRRNSRIST